MKFIHRKGDWEIKTRIEGVYLFTVSPNLAFCVGVLFLGERYRGWWDHGG